MQVNNLCLQAQNPYGIILRHIDLQVCVGEIVSIAGVAGNGQTELLAASSGEVLCPQTNSVKSI